MKNLSLWVGVLCWMHILYGSPANAISGERVEARGGPPRSGNHHRPALSPEWAWVRQEGGPSWEGAGHVAPDGRGNIYVLGGFETMTTVGTNILTSGGPGGSSFLAKYDLQGNLLWVFSPGGSGFWWAGDSAVHLDAAGSVYLMGTFQGELDFGGHKLSSARPEVSLVKVDPQGRVAWAVQADVLWVPDAGFASALDRQGHVLLAGSFSGNIRIGPFLLNTAEDGFDTYLAKFGPDGRVVWARQSGTPEYDWPNAVAADAGGNIYVAGTVPGELQWDPGTGTFRPTYRTLLSRFDSLGNQIWAIHAQGDQNEARQLAVDPAGNAFLAGQFSGTFILGGQSVTRDVARGGSYFARIAPDAQVTWLQSLGNTEFDHVVGLEVDRTGNLHVTGEFAGQASIGRARLNSQSHSEFYVAKYDRQGRPLWARQRESQTFSQPLRLQLDRFGRVYLLGEGGDRPDAYTHLFIASYDRHGRTLWIQDFDSNTLRMWSTFAVDPSGNCFAAGTFQDPITFGHTRLVSRGSGDLFVARLTPGIPARQGQPQR